MTDNASVTERTIEEYLQGATAFPISDEAIQNILYERGIEEGTALSDLTRKQRDLCKADLYMWCAMLSNSSGSVKDSDGNWTHDEGSVSMSDYDKRLLRRMALAIYSRYGETIPSSIKVHAGGMRLWPGV